MQAIDLSRARIHICFLRWTKEVGVNKHGLFGVFDYEEHEVIYLHLKLDLQNYTTLKQTVVSMSCSPKRIVGNFWFIHLYYPLETRAASVALRRVTSKHPVTYRVSSPLS